MLMDEDFANLVGGIGVFAIICVVVLKQKINVAFTGLLEIFAKDIQFLRLNRDAGFELDICRQFAIGEETPARRFEQLVDLDSGGGFFIRHAATYRLGMGGKYNKELKLNSWHYRFGAKRASVTLFCITLVRDVFVRIFRLAVWRNKYAHGRAWHSYCIQVWHEPKLK